MNTTFASRRALSNALQSTLAIVAISLIVIAVAAFTQSASTGDSVSQVVQYASIR